MHLLKFFLICLHLTKAYEDGCRRCVDKQAIDHLIRLNKIFVTSYQNDWPECHNDPSNQPNQVGKCVQLQFQGRNNKTGILQLDLKEIQKLPNNLEKKLEKMYNHLSSYQFSTRGIRIKLLFCKQPCRLVPVTPVQQPSHPFSIVFETAPPRWTLFLVIALILLLLIALVWILMCKKCWNSSRLGQSQFYRGSQPLNNEATESMYEADNEFDYLSF